MQPKEVQVFEKESKKEGRFTTPTEQWDQLAFTLMYQELAPKGFKKFTNGHWRGAEHADIPFLSKKTVQKCQKISAQLVRGFRDKVKKDIIEKVKETESWLLKSEAELKSCWFWQFKKRDFLKYKIAHYKGQIGKAHLIAEELNSVAIK